MPADLTPAEQEVLTKIARQIRGLRDFLNNSQLPHDASRLNDWYSFLESAKAILGNFNNDVSFVATLLAKVYLVGKHPGLEFNAAAKSQSAPGLDIDVSTRDGKRVIGEVKTVDPYQLKDFGAQQLSSLKKDFAKLSTASADQKYLFLTEIRAFELVKAKYQKSLAGVTVVCLADGKKLVL